MTTEKLYYTDPFLQAFTATVLACDVIMDGYRIILNRTAFYPEGGGQPADHGWLGTVPVTDVHEKDGVVFHFCSQPVEKGSVVTGQIDWTRRFDHMQQHSGEHILSGLICATYGYDNVGFHMGADTVTIDFNGPLSTEQIGELEERANRYIWEDHPISITFPSPAQLSTLDYRSKKELSGQVRIVSFPGADCCACCGTHVARSGQVGLVKVLSSQPFRDGVRMEILAGQRAFSYLSGTWAQNREISQALSAKPLEAAAAVHRLQDELAAVKQRCADLESRVFASIAAANQDQGNVLLLEGPMRSDAVRRLADAVAAVCGGRCCVFAGENTHWNYAFVEKGGDLQAFVKSVNAALHGRGGGRGGFAQGSVAADRDAIEAFFQV